MENEGGRVSDWESEGLGEGVSVNAIDWIVLMCIWCASLVMNIAGKAIISSTPNWNSYERSLFYFPSVCLGACVCARAFVRVVGLARHCERMRSM